MKKVFLIVALLSVMLIASCKTTGSGDTGPITTQEQTDEALQQIYNEYKSDLILEGSKSYTVVKGDVLSALSRTQYNNGFYFPIIMLCFMAGLPQLLRGY